MPCAHFDAPLARIVSHKCSSLDSHNRALRLRLPEGVLLMLPGSSALSCISNAPPCKMEIYEKKYIAIDIISLRLKYKGLKIGISMVHQATTIVEDLQADAMAYVPLEIFFNCFINDVIQIDTFAIDGVLQSQTKTGDFMSRVEKLTLAQLHLTASTSVDFRHQMPSANSCALAANDNQLKACCEAPWRLVQREQAA